MRNLTIGQRYRKVSSPSIVWEIVGDRTDGERIRHIRLVSIADRTRTILISEHMLARSDAFAVAAS
jgi:hypothetical protein